MPSVHAEAGPEFASLLFSPKAVVYGIGVAIGKSLDVLSAPLKPIRSMSNPKSQQRAARSSKKVYHSKNRATISINRRQVISAGSAVLGIVSGIGLKYGYVGSSTDQYFSTQTHCRQNQLQVQIGHHSWDGDFGSTAELLAQDLDQQLHITSHPLQAAQLQNSNPTVYNHEGNAKVYGPTCINLPPGYNH